MLFSSTSIFILRDEAPGVSLMVVTVFKKSLNLTPFVFERYLEKAWFGFGFFSCVKENEMKIACCSSASE